MTESDLVNEFSPSDCIAPKGQYRVVVEDMRDGELSLVGDYLDHISAKLAIEVYMLGYSLDDEDNMIFSVYNDQGEKVFIKH